nr:DNA polymerase elongation subunit family B [Ectropis obliqua nucleopolyhedrovirus]
MFGNCRYNCKSYKAFVMPGLQNVHMDKFNVIKYKQNDKLHTYNGYQQKPLDYFMRDVNRVHMQLGIIEGQYVSFKTPQKCFKNKLMCIENDSDTLSDMFNIVQVDALTKEIVPAIMSYDIETHSDGYKFSNAAENHIMSISIVLRKDKINTKVCLFYMNNDSDIKNEYQNGAFFSSDCVYAVHFDDELCMLKAFFKLFQILNADYVLDYNGDKFDLPFIIERAQKLNTSFLRRRHQIKRAKRSADNVLQISRYDLEAVEIETQQLHDKFNNKIDNHLFTYYVHVDLYQFLSTDAEHKNLENYKLNTVAEHYLKASKVDLSITEMLNLYNNNKIEDIIKYNIQDCVLPIDLLLKLEIMDFLYTQCMLLYLCTDDVLCNISHKINIVFFYLCINNKANANENGGKQHKADPFIFNKDDLNITSGKKNTRLYSDAKLPYGTVDLTLLNRKPIPVAKIPVDAIRLCTTKPIVNYKGGKVLNPSSGLKKWVVTLDFNSLYLTIMMYEGACFSNLFIGADGNVYLLKNPNAINPKVLRNLLELRETFKKKRDNFEYNTFKYNLYDKLQNAVKRIANSIYGYFGIYFKVLANYITKIGRSKLMEAIVKIESMNNDLEILHRFNLTKIQFKVIYGDTDSSFIQVEFEENEITPAMRFDSIKSIVEDHVLKNLNQSWKGKGYKMSLENVMSNLILVKKKQYCYINSENKIKYKGWLIKKDMPLFMRQTFRQVVDMYLHNHSVNCGMKLLEELMVRHYDNFGNDQLSNINDYSFSMSYNENSTSKLKKRKNDENDDDKIDGKTARKPTITIAKHCREILLQSGTKHLPGNGDRIPFLLIDIKGKITEKSYPLELFKANSASVRVSWLKHMNIMCNFMNELIQVFGNRPEFTHYFTNICALYMSKQAFDVKYPVLKVVTAKKNVKNKKNVKDADYNDNSDSGDASIDCDTLSSQNNGYQFNMYVKKPCVTNAYIKSECKLCRQLC